MNKKKSSHTVYAVSITDFTMKKHDKGEFKLLDRAVVLHKSIKLEMEKSITYDYHLYASVHPDAVECVPIMTSLGYCIQVRDTPFNISDIKNSYFLSDYPVVVHLDLDTIVLQPMDDFFDMMTSTTMAKTKTSLKEEDIEQFAQTSTMWMKHNNDNTGINNKTIQWSSLLALSTENKILTKPEQINFMFTRDYNMVQPPRKKVYQIGWRAGWISCCMTKST
jgi:alpha-N-acetylglucosamine transferase